MNTQEILNRKNELYGDISLLLERYAEKFKTKDTAVGGFKLSDPIEIDLPDYQSGGSYKSTMTLKDAAQDSFNRLKNKSS